MFKWLKDKDNRGAFLAGLTVLTTLAGGGWFLYETFGAPEPTASTSVPATQQVTIGDGSSGTVLQVGDAKTVVQATGGATVVIGITLEQHEAALENREVELRAELAAAPSQGKDALLRQITEIGQQKSELEASYTQAKEDLRLLRLKLVEIGAEIPQAKLEAAQKALIEGDRSLADSLLAEVRAAEDASVQRAADAAYTRGEIAEQEVRWRDAAVLYADAARLDPTFDHLRAAREFAWRSADYHAALRFGEDLVAVAAREFGPESKKYATALNEHALTLQELGRYAEAEPLFRQVIETEKDALDQDYAIILNNLAMLLQDAGRYAQAEPLMRQAIEIDKQVLSETHPDYVTHINNLGRLLQATGRLGEAEMLYREAMEINKKTDRERHPEHAAILNNLALVLKTTGRFEEAEPLYLQAIQMPKQTLGEAHPTYALRISNYSGLLIATDRFDEAEPLIRKAIGIFEAELGTNHPNTHRARGQYLMYLSEREKVTNP